MAGVDPISLAIIGAGVGAITSPDDPLKGALLGGAAGFTGGTALGAAGAGAAGTAAAGTGAAASGAATGTGAAMAAQPALSYAASNLPAAAAAPGTLASAMAAQPALSYAGINLPGAAPAAAAPAGITGAQAMRGIQMARMLNPGGGTQTAYSPPQLNRGRQVDSASPVLGLLQSQTPRRRPMSLLG